MGEHHGKDKDCCEILKEEHEIILGKLEKLRKSIESKNNTEIEKIIDSIEKDFKLHSLVKEEKILFPIIEEFIPRESGPVGVMMIEHEDLDKSIKEFKIVLKNRNQKKLAELGEHIASVLTDHTFKEDNILFPMAHMHLSKEQHEKIIKEWNELKK